MNQQSEFDIPTVERLCRAICTLCEKYKEIVEDEVGDWYHPFVSFEGRDCDANQIRRIVTRPRIK